MAATLDQETLRTLHGVRIVSGDEEGTGVKKLPGGVYGFTYSPALPNAPLFAVPRYRSFETHKLASEVFVIGFATVDDAAKLDSTREDFAIRIHAQPEHDYTALVKIPYSRIRQHRQYAAPNQHGFSVTVTPAMASV